MSATSAIARAESNRVGGNECTGSAQDDTLAKVMADCVRKIFPKKAWVELTILLQMSERTAKYRLAGKREFSVSELAVMLRSEHGQDVLEAIMGEAAPSWWLRFKGMVTFVDANAEARSATRKAQEAMDAIAGANAIINQTTSILVQDADHRRPHADAMLALGSTTHRAMAQATGGRR